MSPRPALPEPFPEPVKEQGPRQPPRQGVEWGQGASGGSPTFLLCRALTTATATTPSASTRARGTSVETSTLELPPRPAELEGGWSRSVPEGKPPEPSTWWPLGCGSCSSRVTTPLSPPDAAPSSSCLPRRLPRHGKGKDGVPSAPRGPENGTGRHTPPQPWGAGWRARPLPAQAEAERAAPDSRWPGLRYAASGTFSQREARVLPHLPASADALLPPAGSPAPFPSPSFAKRPGPARTLLSASLTRGSMTSLPAAPCTGLTSLDLGFTASLPAAACPGLTSLAPGESRVGPNDGSFSMCSPPRGHEV